MRVGFFGGSFDPIHLGHLFLLEQLIEKNALDEILICPAFISPFKEKNPPKASFEDRLNMLKLVKTKKFKISDIEGRKEGLSYTVDTIKELNRNDLRLILTQESAKEFHKWKDYKVLQDLAPPIIAVWSLLSKDLNFSNNCFVKIKRLDISSTLIRKRLEQGLLCDHLCPKEVLDYIYEHGLYC